LTEIVFDGFPIVPNLTIFDAIDRFPGVQVLFPALTGTRCKSTGSGFFITMRIAKIPK